MWWNFRNNVGMGEVNIERHPLEGLGMREVEVSASLALRSGFSFHAAVVAAWLV